MQTTQRIDISRGRDVGSLTEAAAIAQARRLADQYHAVGMVAVAGRLWHSPRRYSWGIRGQETMTVEALSDGATFEGRHAF